MITNLTSTHMHPPKGPWILFPRSIIITAILPRCTNDSTSTLHAQLRPQSERPPPTLETSALSLEPNLPFDLHVHRTNTCHFRFGTPITKQNSNSENKPLLFSLQTSSTTTSFNPLSKSRKSTTASRHYRENEIPQNRATLSITGRRISEFTH